MPTKKVTQNALVADATKAFCVRKVCYLIFAEKLKRKPLYSGFAANGGEILNRQLVYSIFSTAPTTLRYSAVRNQSFVRKFPR